MVIREKLVSVEPGQFKWIPGYTFSTYQTLSVFGEEVYQHILEQSGVKAELNKLKAGVWGTGVGAKPIPSNPPPPLIFTGEVDLEPSSVSPLKLLQSQAGVTTLAHVKLCKAPPCPKLKAMFEKGILTEKDFHQ